MVSENERNESVERELDRELPPRVLTVFNPRAPDNSAIYSFKDRAFLLDDSRKSLVLHLQNAESLMRSTGDNVGDLFEATSNPNEKDTVQTALRNQFFHNDRSSQTLNPVIRHRGVSTKPPPSRDCNSTVSLCVVNDKYRESLESTRAKSFEGDDKKKPKQDPVYSQEMRRAVRVMERILNQNLDRETFHDLKFFTDPADAFRDFGSLLPLWRFENEKSRRKQVTCIKWNPQYRDLFAVSYGSYEFMKQTAGGVIAVYSLKNAKHPELSLPTELTICALDWNPTKPALLAVGVYDGTVSVVDVRSRNRKFIYHSSVRDSKHTDPVWEVKWLSPDRFISISADGRACAWTMQRANLECELISELKLDPEGALTGLINGLCFDFSLHEEDLYLVGTEEGLIYLCSKHFLAQPVGTFKGHSGGVYAVRWNPFHKEIFVSSSADWTVKVWSVAHKEAPLCSFDINYAVGDVDWSPVSCTVFAAVNANGEIYIFDLYANRSKQVTLQRIVSGKGKLTRVAFNKHEPVLLVGDDRGAVSCLKLSPNLRKTDTDPSNQILKMKQVIDILSD